MRLLIIVLLLFIWIATPAHSQCAVPGCEAATAQVSAAKATARAIITESAPVATATPQMPEVIYIDQTREVVVTVLSVMTVTAIVTATPEPIVTATTTPTVEPTVTMGVMQTRSDGERVSPIEFAGLALFACVAISLSAYAVYRFIFPKRNDDDSGTQWVQTKRGKK